MCYNQTGNINTLEGASLRLVDKFTYLGSSVSSTENNIDTRLTKAWTAIDRLSIIWKSDLTDEMKRSFFSAAVVSILLYGCTTWMLTKRLEKKLDGNYTRMLRAILNKSWRQHPTRRQLYGHLPPITKTIQVRRARHAWHCWRSKDELVSDVLLWTPIYGQAKARRPARTYSSYVRTQDVTQKTCWRRWMIGRSGERWSRISVLAARHDDDWLANLMLDCVISRRAVGVFYSPVGWSSRIRWMHLCREDPPPLYLNECFRYNTKPSDSEVSDLELRVMWVTSSFPLLLGPKSIRDSDWIFPVYLLDCLGCYFFITYQPL